MFKINPNSKSIIYQYSKNKTINSIDGVCMENELEDFCKGRKDSSCFIKKSAVNSLIIIALVGPLTLWWDL